MKKLLFAIAFMMLTINVMAQRYLECGFDAGLGSTTGVDRRLTGSYGITGGLTIENGLGLGVFFRGFQTSREEDSRLTEFPDNDFCFRGYYGGVYAEQIFFRKSFFYMNVGAKWGMGGVNYSNHTVESEWFDPSSGTYNYIYEKADKHFVMSLEPFGGVNFVFGESFTLAAGAEYRNLFFTNLHCGNVHIAGTGDLNGFVYLLKAKFRVDF
ncbi:MAG: hypothetical protein J6T60_09850 [Bacteroidales bacterium]|nr:hypothetical protein [Bacteroidales bacterium]